TSKMGHGESGCFNGSPPSLRKSGRGADQVLPSSRLCAQYGFPENVRITQKSRPSGSLTMPGSWQVLTLKPAGSNGAARAFVPDESHDSFRAATGGLSSTFSKRMNST